MQILTSKETVQALRKAGQHPGGLLDLIERRMAEVIAAFDEGGWRWDPEEHGAFVLLEQGDDARDLHEVGLNPLDQGLVGAIWEVCYHHEDLDLFEVFVLYGNDSGWTFFVPDEPWLDEGLRTRLRAEAEPVRKETHERDQPPF